MSRPCIDVQACFERLKQMATGGKVPDWAREAVEQLTNERPMLEAGMKVDGLVAFDNEERR